MGKQMVITTAFLAVFMVSPTFAQTAEQRRFAGQNPCVFNVKMARTVGTKGNTFKTNYGSHDIVRYRSSSYSVDIKWTGKGTADFTAEFIFMASQDRITKPLYCVTNGFQLAQGISTNFIVSCPSTYHRDTKLVAIGEREEEGAKLKGVVARLKRDGKIIKTFISNGTWAKQAWDEDLDTYYKPISVGEAAKLDYPLEKANELEKEEREAARNKVIF